MHGGVVAAALIRQFPDYEMLLAQMHLEFEDIISGVRWYNHIQDLIGQHAMPKRTGGIARDWSFGYTPLLKRFGVNLSEGGVAFGSSRFVPPNHHIAMRLVFLPSNAGLVLFAKVIRCDAVKGGEYQMAAKFHRISDSQQQLIGQQIMRAQMAERRKNQHSLQ